MQDTFPLHIRKDFLKMINIGYLQVVMGQPCLAESVITFSRLVSQCGNESFHSRPSHLSRQVSLCRKDLNYDFAFRISLGCQMHPNPVLETDLRSSIPSSSSASISPPLVLFSPGLLSDMILDLLVGLKWLQGKHRKKKVAQTEKVVPFITGEVAGFLMQ